MAVKKQSTVLKMEDILNKSKGESATNLEKSEVTSGIDTTNTRPKRIKKALENKAAPRGMPKSGRVWKTEKTRFSSIVKTKGIRNSFEKKQALRTELKRVKEASKAIIAAKQEEKNLKKQRRKDNLERQEINRKKSEIVQVIKNSNKIKKAKKKHLRSIEKRDTTNM